MWWKLFYILCSLVLSPPLPFWPRDWPYWRLFCCHFFCCICSVIVCSLLGVLLKTIFDTCTLYSPTLVHLCSHSLVFSCMKNNGMCHVIKSVEMNLFVVLTVVNSLLHCFKIWLVERTLTLFNLNELVDNVTWKGKRGEKMDENVREKCNNWETTDKYFCDMKFGDES